MFPDACYYDEQCKICGSPNKKYYDQLRAEGWSYRELSKRAEDLDEWISHQSFYRHFHNHLAKGKPIENRPKRGKFRILIDSYDELKDFKWTI